MQEIQLHPAEQLSCGESNSPCEVLLTSRIADASTGKPEVFMLTPWAEHLKVNSE